MLEVSQIRKYYDSQLLLDDISFTVADDETVCLLGPSGGGKSTLLRIIAGLEDKESGKVFWNGEDFSNMPAHKRQFGLMFQDYALFPHMSVAENVAFGLRMQSIETVEIQKRVAEILALVDMRGFSDRRVTDLSGGEQQRIALARALVPRPHLLMLDEPLGALDRALREQLSADLRAVLNRMDIPVIYVTHDQEEAFAFADRLLVLHNGRIIQSGSPAQVYNHPASSWLAAFFGHKNQMPGVVMETSPLKIQTDYGLLECGSQMGKYQDKQAVTLVMPATAGRIGGNDKNMIPAIVKNILFQGKGFMVDFELADGKVLAFFLDHALQPGEQVKLTFNPQSILCYGRD